MQYRFDLTGSLLLLAALSMPLAYSAEPSKEASVADPTHSSATASHASSTENSAPPHKSSLPDDITRAIEGDALHKGNECKISLVDPTVGCAESQKVLDVLHKLVTAYSSGDMKTYEQYLDEHCTTFDEGSKRLVTGRDNVIADIKTRIQTFSPSGPTPLKSFTIDQPYAKVVGDTAVVTFVAYREVGGKHPTKEKCHVTDVFVKRGETWKKLHFRGSWKKA